MVCFIMSSLIINVKWDSQLSQSNIHKQTYLKFSDGHWWLLPECITMREDFIFYHKNSTPFKVNIHSNVLQLIEPPPWGNAVLGISQILPCFTKTWWQTCSAVPTVWKYIDCMNRYRQDKCHTLQVTIEVTSISLRLSQKQFSTASVLKFYLQ